MSPERKGALVERAKGCGGCLLVALATGFAATFTFEAFWVVYYLKLTPVDQEMGMILRIVGAAVAGGTAVAVQLFGVRRRLVRVFLSVLVASGSVLLVLHVAFVYKEPDKEKARGGSVVISWSRAGCEGESPNCKGLERADCLSNLSWDQDLIDQCWGHGKILTVRLALTLCAFVASGAFGGSVGYGALTLRWRMGKSSERRPLRLFIGYRRADTGAAVDVLAKRLSDRFGAGNVFRDVEAIRLGEDFRQAVRQSLSGCDVFLLMIGPDWLDARDSDGARRLDRADDPVRIEIETAIARGLLIVPVLVGGAGMPRSDRMPDGFEELSNRAGAALLGDPAAPDDPAFAASVEALIRRLGQVERAGPSSEPAES